MDSTTGRVAAFLAASSAIVALLRFSNRSRRAPGKKAAPKTPSPPLPTSGGSLNPWDKPSKPHKPFSMGTYEKAPGVHVDDVFVLKVPHLRDTLSHLDAKLPNLERRNRRGGQCHLPYKNLITDDYVILGDIVRVGKHAPVSRGFVRAGVRPSLFFDPTKVKAAIVTAGGLCPGMNNVIRQIVRDLHHLYGVDTVYGVKDGFIGFHGAEPELLTVKSVNHIHHFGGSCIGSGRGGFDADKIIHFLQKYGVNQLYIIGGDGTMRAANALSQELLARELPITVAGLCKTVDNDVGLIDRSFGFTTAVAAAQDAIQAAKTEAVSAHNGIGLVKLMGREAGFIAAYASLASGDVDACLIPEVPIVLHGEAGILPHIKSVLERRENAVVVIAEGAGQELMKGVDLGVDAGGNKRLPRVGEFMADTIKDYFKGVGMNVTLKYIDPSYMIRSVKANPSDGMYCMLLGQNAVHAAMAGFTAFCVGLLNNRMVILPMTAICDNSPRVMDPMGRTWERILSMTGQPVVDGDLSYAASHTISGSTRV